MLRLILVRHAKSAWDDPALTDFERPLARRGIEAAAWIGDALTRHGLIPDRIVCSTSRRTRETLELALSHLPANRPGPEVVWSEAVYAERDATYLPLIAQQGGRVAVLMLLGHNSATEETVAVLAGETNRIMGFPTAGIAVIDFRLEDWAEIAPGTGQLVRFLRPPKG